MSILTIAPYPPPPSNVTVGAVSYPSPTTSSVREAILPVCSSNAPVIVPATVGSPDMVIRGRFLYPKP